MLLLSEYGATYAPNMERLALAYRPAGWNLLLLILLVTVAAVELAVGVAVEVAALLGMEAAAVLVVDVVAPTMMGPVHCCGLS